MLVNRFRLNYVLVVVILLLSVTAWLLRDRYSSSLGEVWHSTWLEQELPIADFTDSEYEEEDDIEGSTVSEADSQAGADVEVKIDKTVVLAKVHDEDVSWVSSELPDWQPAIYFMDEPGEGALHPPRNKGREAMAYLSYLIDHYDRLPETMVFVHAHLEGWPKAWHTDSEGYNNVNSIRSLKLDYLETSGYVNMRCIHEPGCPAEIQVLRQDEDRTAEHAMRDAWPYMFGGNQSDIPEVIAQPCCSQFAVSKAQALERSKGDYQHYRQWLLDTSVDDDTSGRVFEYLWHVIFGKDPEYCPDTQHCWCSQFGRC